MAPPDVTKAGAGADEMSQLSESKAFAAAGVNEICLRLHDDPDEAIRLIGEHVIPALGSP